MVSLGHILAMVLLTCLGVRWSPPPSYWVSVGNENTNSFHTRCDCWGRRSFTSSSTRLASPRTERSQRTFLPISVLSMST